MTLPLSNEILIPLAVDGVTMIRTFSISFVLNV
jgi:hypothetical protein